MAKEAFSVGLEAAAYHRKPFEGEPTEVFAAREQEARNNMLRYLGEYRLAVKFDEIFYQEGQNSSGERFLRAKENAPVRDIFRNFIRQKEIDGQSSKREVAECLGFEKVEEKFLAGEDFLFLWISPPGAKEDGYGDYSFTFVGEVRNGQIREIPYRNKLQLEEHREIIRLFSNQADSFQIDVDFLANPIFIPKTKSRNSAEDILAEIGEKEAIDISWKSRLETRLASLMDIFIDAVKRNAPEHELNKIKRAIENFTINKKNEIVSGEFTHYDLNTKNLIDTYGSYAPPVVGGSCGNSSSSTLMEFQQEFNLEPDKYGDRKFDCPQCGETNVRPKDQLLTKCQHCGSKKVAC